MSRFGYSIEEIRKWLPGDGIALLSMPSMPALMEILLPTKLMGYAETLRYAKEHFRVNSLCEICKESLTRNTYRLIDSFVIKIESKKILFKGFRNVCPLCYDSINIEKVYSDYKNHKVNRGYILEVVRHCFELVGAYNEVLEKPIRVKAEYLELLKSKELATEIKALIDVNKIKFHRLTAYTGSPKDWRLVTNFGTYQRIPSQELLVHERFMDDLHEYEKRKNKKGREIIDACPAEPLQFYVRNDVDESREFGHGRRKSKEKAKDAELRMILEEQRKLRKNNIVFEK
jgi:hypothetical protein